jgi:hypothetical protein
MAYSQLRILFDRAPHLYSLKLCYLTHLFGMLFELRSASIRRVNFDGQHIIGVLIVLNL